MVLHYLGKLESSNLVQIAAIEFDKSENFENQFRYDKVTDSLKGGTFLRHSVCCCQLYSVPLKF